MTLVMGGGQWIGVMFTYSRNTHEYRLQVTAEARRRTRGVSRDASRRPSPRSPVPLACSPAPPQRGFCGRLALTLRSLEDKPLPSRTTSQTQASRAVEREKFRAARRRFRCGVGTHLGLAAAFGLRLSSFPGSGD